ncbi:MAG: serine hydrolase domain-containing protein [Gemmatimonadaceae bacterium]
MRSFLRERKIPSATIAVLQHGRTVKLAGYGMANLELRVPATPQSRYEIGSITKQFTAEALMLLVSEGRLSLDDSLGRYLPEAPASWGEIRIRHLLTHTSGLYDWEGDTTFALSREYSVADFVRFVSSHPLAFAPGSRFAYTNSAYPLLGAVVQRVAGVPYEEFVTRRIMEPAGMINTRFRDNFALLPDRASGYAEVDTVMVNGQPIRPRILVANGGIVSSAADMAHWCAALWGGRLLPPRVLADMLTPTTLSNGSTVPVGMGWFLAETHGHRFAVHNGSTVAGYSSVVYRFLDDDLSIVVLMNIDRFDAVNVLAQRVAAYFIPALAAPAPKRGS